MKFIINITKNSILYNKYLLYISRSLFLGTKARPRRLELYVEIGYGCSWDIRILSFGKCHENDPLF